LKTQFKRPRERIQLAIIQ